MCYFWKQAWNWPFYLEKNIIVHYDKTVKTTFAEKCKILLLSKLCVEAVGDNNLLCVNHRRTGVWRSYFTTCSLQSKLSRNTRLHVAYDHNDIVTFKEIETLNFFFVFLHNLVHIPFCFHSQSNKNEKQKIIK